MKGIIGLGMRGMRLLSDAIKAPLCGLKVLDIGQCQVGSCHSLYVKDIIVALLRSSNIYMCVYRICR